MLKTDNIKAICSTDTYDNGRRLCAPGKIRKIQITQLGEETCKVRGLVQGNFGFFHSTRLTLNSSHPSIVENYDCNCYDFSQSPSPCRHCIALALAVAEDGTIDFGARLKPGKPKEEPPVPEIPVRPTGYPDPAEQPVPTSDKSDLPPAPEPQEPVSEAAEEEGGDPVPETQDLREMEILLGHETLPSEEDAGESEMLVPVPLYWYPNDSTQVFHVNTGIIGTMGTGKTQFTKSLITQLYRQQRNNFNGGPLGILVFDYKGDYNSSKMDFVKAVNAKVLRPYHLPFNPLSIFIPRVFTPVLPIHTANTFKDTISRTFHLGPKQQHALNECILAAYSAAGIDPGQPETWNNRAPTFEMVYDIYEKDDTIPKNDSLAAAMQKIHAFQLFEPKPYNTAALFDVLKGVVVIDLSGYDPDLQSLVVAILLDQFYSQMHASGSSATDGTLRQLRKLILVDEADSFMEEDYPSLKKIMKEGREFGVGTILSTQSLRHFASGEDYAKYIWTWVVHNVADLKKSDVEFIFKTDRTDNETAAHFQNIKNLGRFHSAVKIGNDEIVYIQDKPFFELIRESDPA